MLEIHTRFFDRDGACAQFLPPSESLTALVQSKKSLIRWGDGESTIATGGGINFQPGSLALTRDILRIVREYSERSEYYLAVPCEFLATPRSALEARRKYRLWKKTRYLFRAIFPRLGVIYLDAMLFRESSPLANAEISQLWADADTVLFVHSNYKYFCDFRDKNLGKEVVFLSVPSADAYNGIDSLEKRIVETARSERARGRSLVVLISAGPAGKVLVWRLSRRGLRCLDLGHYFDFKFYELVRPGQNAP